MGPNEAIFFSHLILIVLINIWTLRLGREALYIAIALQSLLANAFVLKQVDLFGLHVTCSDALMIGSMTALNFLRSFFGKEDARRAVLLSFCALFLFCILSQFQLFYIPSAADETQSAFVRLFSASPRLFAASLFTYGVAQQIDLFCFQAIPLPLAARTTLSLLISQAFDTVLFSFLGLYGLVESLFDIIWMSFSIKAIIIVAFFPFLALARRMSARSEEPPAL